MRIKASLATLAISLALLFLHCSDNTPVGSSGSGSETENALIVGHLYYQDGSPAKNTVIRYYAVDYNPSPLAKASAGNYIMTDTNGAYTLDPLPEGDYNLMGESGILLSFADSVPVKRNYKIVLPSDTLKAPGGVRGVVKLENSNDSRSVLIVVIGIDKFTVPQNLSGDFRLGDIPEGEHLVRLFTFGYYPYDTLLNIFSGREDTLRDTIVLKYTGLQAPQGLTARYDTLTGTTHLSWNRVDNATLAGYVVFRNDSASDMPVSISGNRLVTDTSYVDTVFPNLLLDDDYCYYYRLRSQDNQANLSESYSLPVKVQAVSPTRVRTFLTWTVQDSIYKGLKHDSASIKDTIGFKISFSNATRKVDTLKIFISDSGVVLSKYFNALAGADSFDFVWNTSGHPLVVASALDEAGTVWRDSFSLTILQDPPWAEAGGSVFTMTKAPVNLSGNGGDGYGAIVEQAWDIGATGSFAPTLTGRCSFTTPDSACHYSCVFRVKDDDGNYAFDTVMVIVNDSTVHLFWYHAQANGYNLAESNPGPGIGTNIIFHEGIIMSASVAEYTGNSTEGFFLGSGLDDLQGRCGVVWSRDLCKMNGSATRAVLKGEFRDGWSGNAFCNAGPITIRCGVVDFQENISVWGADSFVSETATWQDFLNPLVSTMGYDMSNPTLQAEEIILFEAPAGRLSEADPSVLDGQFIEIDITDQVNWILQHTGPNKGSYSGQYAIVFLVAPGQGSTGKFNLYAAENLPGVGSGSDNPWTNDGNTIHLLVYGLLNEN